MVACMKKKTTNLEGFAIAIAKLGALPKGETGETFAFVVGSVEAVASTTELVEAGKAVLSLAEAETETETDD
jgi:hypothetical protein